MFLRVGQAQQVAGFPGNAGILSIQFKGCSRGLLRATQGR